MKRILLLGASGSIGTQTIDVIKQHPDELKLVGVSVGKNIDYLIDVLKYFSVRYAYTIERNEVLEEKFPDVRFFYGESGLKQMAELPDYDMLVNALVGFTGFLPTLTAIRNHKDIALANKETLVAGGALINEAIRENGVKLFPIDSEHAAILQCLQGHPREDVRRLIITASGGAFRDLDRSQLEDVTLEQALAHPVWNMGAKITIDSATMMNKGFEVIEAHYLFDIPYEKIDVIIHKQSIIHSMVEYNDGSIMAQLGCPDMHLMIKYALLYPNHLYDQNTKYLDLDSLTSLDFRKMDYQRYPLVKLAKQVGQYEGNYGAVLNGANDEAVSLFLKKEITSTT
ncbi:MAG: 1-deoxy-D-xylulose-5-phosphate reductoisomerase, partial [Erysipelotrichaceae bacterium]|nr:1-deoxy-D-xylulose-5-phosphate reductoisomerase [Erysipelotrichaceae bacterium]